MKRYKKSHVNILIKKKLSGATKIRILYKKNCWGRNQGATSIENSRPV